MVVFIWATISTVVINVNGSILGNAPRLATRLRALVSYSPSMPGDVTQPLSIIDSGDPRAAQELLPVVYDELRRLATSRMAREGPGQTLQPTALVSVVDIHRLSIMMLL